jgi:hypothetical protein
VSVPVREIIARKTDDGFEVSKRYRQSETRGDDKTDSMDRDPTTIPSSNGRVPSRGVVPSRIHSQRETPDT